MTHKHYGLLSIYLGFAAIVLGMVYFSGCAPVRRDQIERDRHIIDRNLRDFIDAMRNEFDKNQVRNLRAKVNKELTDQP